MKCMENNRKPGVKAHRNRDYFYKLLQEGSFKDAVEKSKNGIYDIVLWGNWSEKNYGSELTYYALYQVLSDLNYNVLMVERPKTAVWGPNEGTPLFQTTPYERHERIAGESHYPLTKMLSLAFDGITSLSIKPIRIITALGTVIAGLSFLGVIWSIVMRFMGNVVAGWSSMTCIICLIGGVQLVCLGILGEYIGKIYMEVKHRPRYIISERTEVKDTSNSHKKVHY